MVSAAGVTVCVCVWVLVCVETVTEVDGLDCVAAGVRAAQ